MPFCELQFPNKLAKRLNFLGGKTSPEKLFLVRVKFLPLEAEILNQSFNLFETDDLVHPQVYFKERSTHVWPAFSTLKGICADYDHRSESDDLSSSNDSADDTLMLLMGKFAQNCPSCLY